jgi:hypothetical protein
MLLGMTCGEIALVVFVFGLVYSASRVPRLGAFIGRKLAPRPGSRPSSDA